jgi:hypothetical protein
MNKKKKKKKKKKDCRESTGKSIEKEKQNQEKTVQSNDGLSKMMRRSSCGPGYSAAKAQLSSYSAPDSLDESFGTVSTFASSVSGSSHSSSDRRRQQRRLSCPGQTYISIRTVEIISADAGIKW